MVVVVNGHADVVQHARGPQQFALARVARVQPERGELVEHRERELGDMPGVRDVHAVARGEVEHARAPHVLDQRRVARREVALEEDPLAQAGLGHLHAVEPADLEHHRGDDRGGEDHVGAGLLYPRQRAFARRRLREAARSAPPGRRARARPPARRGSAGRPRAARHRRGSAAPHRARRDAARRARP